VSAEDHGGTRKENLLVIVSSMSGPEATPEVPGVEPPASADGDVKQQYSLDNPLTEGGGRWRRLC